MQWKVAQQFMALIIALSAGNVHAQCTSLPQSQSCILTQAISHLLTWLKTNQGQMLWSHDPLVIVWQNLYLKLMSQY